MTTITEIGIRHQAYGSEIHPYAGICAGYLCTEFGVFEHKGYCSCCV